MTQAVQNKPVSFNSTTYSRQELHENGQTYWVYVAEPWKHKSVVAALIAGYRKGGAA